MDIYSFNFIIAFKIIKPNFIKSNHQNLDKYYYDFIKFKFFNYKFINQVGILKFIHFNFLNSHKNSFCLIIPLRFFKHYLIKSNPIDFNNYYDFLKFKVLITNIMALNQIVMVIFLLLYFYDNIFERIP